MINVTLKMVIEKIDFNFIVSGVTFVQYVTVELLAESECIASGK